MEVLNQTRIQIAKCAFSTRRVSKQAMKTVLKGARKPKVGDLVLARVASIGSHKNIELPTGRKASLSIGDEIVLAFGNRYAPDQYEAYVPEKLESCHMVAAGGIAAKAVSWHQRLSGPTCIEPIGFVGNAKGEVINLSDHALPNTYGPTPSLVFGVFGTSMNSGKTTTAAALVKGFASAGYRAGAAKITGTGAGGDLWLMRDKGATEVLDFTDVGFPTTFGVSCETLVNATSKLLQALGGHGCSVAVLEIADGLYQRETAELAQSANFKKLLNGTFFAAGDAMGAVAGAKLLDELGHNVMGIAGAMTRSPLAIREVTEAINRPVYRLSELSSPDFARSWAEDGETILNRALGE